MSNLENKLKKIIDTFNKENREIAFKDIKKLSEKYNLLIMKNQFQNIFIEMIWMIQRQILNGNIF